MRLSNNARLQLAQIPVWTTKDDRRRALSYEDQQNGDLFYDQQIQEVLEATRAGQKSSIPLGVLVAIARYEESGWQPDGCYTRFRRYDGRDLERLSLEALISWMDHVESGMQKGLITREKMLIRVCRREEEKLNEAQQAVARAQQLLKEHYQALHDFNPSVCDRILERRCTHCGDIAYFTSANEPLQCTMCGAEANHVMRWVCNHQHACFLSRSDPS